MVHLRILPLLMAMAPSVVVTVAAKAGAIISIQGIVAVDKPNDTATLIATIARKVIHKRVSNATNRSMLPLRVPILL